MRHLVTQPVTFVTTLLAMTCHQKLSSQVSITGGGGGGGGGGGLIAKILFWKP